ncbi:Uncharacterised protein [Shigella sonnei]|nr:Uncharacterised protein [Shigella sonnei]CSE51535.1 Uncharacterised protein [Shigella sonnei]CSE69466.1 Uncharacterised protein [Shigella sonnei]CSE93944.1 Uncharacterised protein [Shigella sonnei]CSF14316.1 Uncharacterised protein [Shigella sonnei]
MQQLFLLLVQAYRCFDDNAAQQITLCATADRLDAFTAHTEKLTGLGFARHFQFDATIKGRYFDFATQRRHSEVDRDFAIEVVAFTLENRVLFNLNLNVQIACRCAMLARFTFARKTDAVSSVHPCRDFNGQRFAALNTTMTMTFVARIFDQRTAALTVWTGLLYSEKSLAHLHLTRTMTGRTGLRLCTWFCTATVANVTLFQSRNADLFGHATYSFFEGELHVIA